MKAQQKNMLMKHKLYPNISKQSKFSVMARRVKRSHEHPQSTFMKTELKKNT